jgi:Fe-S cluster assembly ATP-binding protein
MALLEIRNLRGGIKDLEILKGINLTVNRGEVHAIMGPNGSGKSTLGKVLAGHEAYQPTGGAAFFQGKDLFELTPEERANEGLFLAFQYPVEIPGVSNAYFLRAAINEKKKYHGQPELSAGEFRRLMDAKMKLVDMDPELAKRPVNEDFSGGEKKRNEVFHMAVLEPTLSILDETDSGLDIDALKVVSYGINQQRSAENAMIVITHYQRLLTYVVPDFVHVMFEGRIVKSGNKELALELEEKGYDWIREEVAAAG